MRNLNISDYLEKYSVFYLSKYSVTEKKFVLVLQKKIIKDYLLKKLSKTEKEEAIKKIDLYVKKYSKMNLINEKVIIKNRIENLMKKGISLKRILLKLKSDKFNEALIYSEMNVIKNKDIDKKSIQIFSKKKKLGCYDIHWDQYNEKIYNKTLNKLLSNGFNIETCRSFLKNC